MSAAQHTPGPWEIVGDGELQALVIRSIPGPDDSLDGTVCTIDFGSGDEESVTSKRKQADAVLIAAAPELLESLDELLPKDWRDGTMDHMPGVRAARVALAKVRP